MNKLLNNSQKKITFLFVVVSIVTSLFGWKSFIFSPTEFSQLKKISGVIYFGRSQSGSKNIKSYTPIYIISEQEKNQLYGHQFNFNSRQLYINKNANAWIDGDNFLYQLEVDGMKIVLYEDKKSTYVKEKRDDVLFSVFFMLISLILFYVAQQIEPSTEKENNKL